MQKTKEKKHLSKGKIALIQYSTIGVCAITVGITTGVILKKKLGPVVTDYSGFCLCELRLYDSWRDSFIYFRSSKASHQT